MFGPFFNSLFSRLISGILIALPNWDSIRKKLSRFPMSLNPSYVYRKAKKMLKKLFKEESVMEKTKNKWDKKKIILLCKRDDSTWDEFIRDFHERLFKWCIQFTHYDIDRAWDLYQDSVCRFIRYLPVIKPRGSLSSNLYRIVRNTFLNTVKDIKEERKCLELYAQLCKNWAIPAANAEMVANEILMIVECLSTERQFEIFLLYYSGSSDQEIAEELSIEIKTVRVHIHHIRKKLKKYLHDFESDKKCSLN